MQINMTTFAGRKHHYIHRSLESLFASDWPDTNLPVNLVIGSEDESHVHEYEGHPAVRIVPWDMETTPSMRLNCTLNKVRALRYGDDDATVTCEDDILFPRNWFSALTAATAEMGDEEYIMSLCVSRLSLENVRFVKGKCLVKQYPGYKLQGAQALFYPAKALRYKVADYLLNNLRRASGDNIIGHYARAYAALYATKEPLVEDIGQISCFHQ